MMQGESSEESYTITNSEEESEGMPYYMVYSV